MNNYVSILKKLKSIILVAVVFLSTFTNTNGQNGIQLNTDDAYRGYTLCSGGGNRTYLLDNCGEITNTWLNTIPRYYCRLTDEGNLLYIDDQISTIREKDWDNNNIVNLTPLTNNLYLDYEVIKLDNGNYLSIARRIENNAYFEDLGWPSNAITPIYIDVIVEIAPSGEIVWEWNLGDHTIQDRDSDASNFGVVADHPELVDINTISNYDWQYPESFMINSFDYNPDLDQIVVSVRKVSEIMVIDHSTTTEEAKGSTGGNSGKGGDILYRWGNPQNYGQGTEDDRVLYYQHNPNWIRYGEHQGKLIVFNNGLTKFTSGFGDMSSVHIIDTPIDSDGNYELIDDQAFAPENPDVTIDDQTTGTAFYSGYTSGAQVLPNGNIYITVGRNSDFIEVDTEGNPAWKYRLSSNSYIYRTEQYAPDFPGFEGRELEGDGTVEFPSSTYNCELFTSTNDLGIYQNLVFQFDSFEGKLQIQNLETRDNYLEIRNIHGQLVFKANGIHQNSIVDVNPIAQGLYFATVFDSKQKIKKTEKIVKF